MDQELRDLERSVEANPTDKNLVQRLVLARRRAGVKPINVKDTIMEFKYLQEEAERAQQQMMSEGSDLFDRFSQAIFNENPELTGVVIQGWTPGFNDGDVCRHGMQVMVSTSDFEDNGYEDDEEEEENDDPEESPEEEDRDYSDRDNISLLGKKNASLSEDKAVEIRQQYEAFDDILEYIYDTNWQLTITRQSDGKVKITQDDYDCGY